MNLKVSDIGERGLLEILQKFCPAEIIGDDAAVLDLPGDRSLVVTTDVLVNNVHFSDATTSAEDVGWRAAAANLSDLAAMGAEAIAITVGLALPPDLSVSWVERLYQGMTDCLQRYNTPIVGGDICRASEISVSITALGAVAKDGAIRRYNANVGDSIVITGYHGLSRAGLELLLHPETGRDLSERDREILIQAHQRPKPRLDCLPYLQEIVKRSRIAGMDSSDGLADALLQICRGSGTGARIDRVPLSPALVEYVSPEQALDWALYGGEDFELVLCMTEEFAGGFAEHAGEGAAIIGRIVSGDEVTLADGKRLDFSASFQHFSP
ncbi:thiamine-phosphate kinase [Pannus brasiliensis CCIBt3594]|uniref:Thiamine-monophosphate kinase n=1 Tax=Pannus brasiliensis CCIBt3594 TaxID=1427578 RepID=A0AAW9QT21_9CHRO